ncbi:MAG: hypothetical protein HXS46_13425 [Theionarchaea archaeon]|nr:MAG: hypothetical protein AYK18_15680 [Theionarchaea archaeon DG-70]MBU7011682.1 hypothetical protein [Theionarchaea archaeon]
MMQIKNTIWDGIYVLFVSIILANYWIGFHLGVLSPLPLLSSVTYIMAGICGAFIYLFMKSVRKAFFSTMLMCILACFITSLALFIPAHLGIVDAEVSFYISVRVYILMFLYVFPFGVAGCMIAAYLYPD